MIEEFTLEAARACDVVLLAVSGDFALEWVPMGFQYFEIAFTGRISVFPYL